VEVGNMHRTLSIRLKIWVHYGRGLENLFNTSESIHHHIRTTHCWHHPCGSIPRRKWHTPVCETAHVILLCNMNHTFVRRWRPSFTWVSSPDLGDIDRPPTFGPQSRSVTSALLGHCRVLSPQKLVLLCKCQAQSLDAIAMLSSD
jgi:hypothetical protein